METKVTTNYVKTAAQKFDFKTIFMLSLPKKNISSVGAIAECANLKTLDLSKNNLASVSGLERCVSLTILNLSYNKISSLTILTPLNDLQRLEA